MRVAAFFIAIIGIFSLGRVLASAEKNNNDQMNSIYSNVVNLLKNSIALSVMSAAMDKTIEMPIDCQESGSKPTTKLLIYRTLHRVRDPKMGGQVVFYVSQSRAGFPWVLIGYSQGTEDPYTEVYRAQYGDQNCFLLSPVGTAGGLPTAMLWMISETSPDNKKRCLQELQSVSKLNILDILPKNEDCVKLFKPKQQASTDRVKQ
uniref:Putative secreted protein n=1 Tax=Amblyomma triste TaxID=251400 RepID=A0A023G2V8_AMBTT